MLVFLWLTAGIPLPRPKAMGAERSAVTLRDWKDGYQAVACNSAEAFLLGCEPERRAVVMHDQVETMTPADRIVVLRDRGSERRCRRTGWPTARTLCRERYVRPGDTLAAQFIGRPSMNLLPIARLRERRPGMPDPVRRVSLRPDDLKVTTGRERPGRQRQVNDCFTGKPSLLAASLRAAHVDGLHRVRCRAIVTSNGGSAKMQRCFYLL